MRNKKQSKRFTKTVKVLAVRYGISPAPPSSEESLLHLCAVFLDLVRPIRCEIKNMRFTLFNSICTAVLRAYIWTIYATSRTVIPDYISFLSIIKLFIFWNYHCKHLFFDLMQYAIFRLIYTFFAVKIKKLDFNVLLKSSFLNHYLILLYVPLNCSNQFILDIIFSI